MTITEAIAAERARCAALLDERAGELEAKAQFAVDVHQATEFMDRADESSYLAAVLRCTCSPNPLEVPAANHAGECPVYQWWVSNEANFQEGA